VVMKKIATKSYVESQVQNFRFDPKRLMNPQQQPQNNPKINAFQQSFFTLGLNGISAISQPDSIILNNIQMEIRKKLRSFGIQVGF